MIDPSPGIPHAGIYLRLMAVYAACLAAGFAVKALGRKAKITARTPGPGIARKFKAFFLFQVALLSLAFWWLPGLAVFLLVLAGFAAYEVACLSKTAGNRPGYPFRPGLAWGLVALCVISFSGALLFAAMLGYGRAWTAGSPFLAWLFLLVAVFDGFSQIWGEVLGGPKMVPRLSPGKTWNGFLGGAAFSAGVAGVGVFCIYPWMPEGAATVLGLAVGMLAFLGDITASWVKRRLGVKDFSNLLGAQGGVLDRVDSLLWLGAALGWAAFFLSPLLDLTPRP